jgi:hypothetical protein
LFVRGGLLTAERSPFIARRSKCLIAEAKP